MPLNQPIQKRYFSISEVAKLLDVKPSLLRFWEKEFKQIQPKTNARGKRAYKQEDIDVIRRIYDLVKVQGLTLEGARKALTSRKGEAANAAKRRCWQPKRPSNLRPSSPSGVGRARRSDCQAQADSPEVARGARGAPGIRCFLT